MKRTRAFLTLAILAVLSMASAMPSAPPMTADTDSVLVTDVCVTIYENSGWFSKPGDSWTRCGSPNALTESSLVGDTSGLHSGCQGLFIRSDWNDCVSSASYSGLPANYQIRFYTATAYGGDIVYCFDNAHYGSANHANFNFGANDVTSSWRVGGGKCY